MVSRLTVQILVAGALLAAAGCTGDTNPVRDLVVGVGAGPEPAATPDFVRTSRPSRIDYIPVGTRDAGPQAPPRTADQVKAEEAALDAVRTANEAAAARAAAAGGSEPPEPAAATDTPAPAKPAQPARRVP
jgi:pyruvate/2-oxoglutarate dehydrogenase complex dihydrolipoamide acyltransferase (E2) component